MVSYDHFRHGLRIRFQRAEAEGKDNIAITSVEFCNSFRKGAQNVKSCCQAMKDEMRAGDVLEHERDSGVGLIIRYRLPRAD